MQVLIVEDEKLAADRLQTLLKEYDPSVQVCACTESIEETVQYLRTHPHPDLLLLDIHLSDGHSFEIFNQVSCNKPVIFTTAYDQYALPAFKVFSIDYILKPVTLEALAAAMNKLRSLHMPVSAIDPGKLLSVPPVNRYKKRVLGKVGQRLFFVDVRDIAYFQADNKIVHLVDREGNRYVADATMERLEEQLDPKSFFRLNRSFIVNIEAIHQVRPYYNSRLKLFVKGAQSSGDMIISRDRVAEFRQWAEA